MFRRIDGLAQRRAVTLRFEGREVRAREGDTLAVALLAAGVDAFRSTPVSGAARAPLCMMGACFECLVEVDGRPNQQACAVVVREGMQVRLQQGARELDPGTGALPRAGAAPGSEAAPRVGTVPRAERDPGADAR